MPVKEAVGPCSGSRCGSMLANCVEPHPSAAAHAALFHMCSRCVSVLPRSPVAMQEVLINVAPKKANWDLRRDIAGSLARLERRTQVWCLITHRGLGLLSCFACTVCFTAPFHSFAGWLIACLTMTLLRCFHVQTAMIKLMQQEEQRRQEEEQQGQ